MPEKSELRWGENGVNEDAKKIAEYLDEKYDIAPYSVPELREVIKGAARVGELDLGEESQILNLDGWFTRRVKKNTVALSWEDYHRALGNGLRILLKGDLMKADMGGARQREVGQHWTDLIRGYLGEFAFKKFLNDRFDVQVKLKQTGVEGGAEEHDPTDVTHVLDDTDEWREVENTISIKTSKLRSMWLPIFSRQLDHSTAFAFVKLGIPLNHLLVSLKETNSLRVLLEDFDDTIVDEILTDIPGYKPIPSYIPGFAYDQDFREKTLKEDAKRSIIHLVGGTGKVPEDPPDDYDRYKIEGIDSLQEEYIASTGSLRWEPDEWNDLIESF